MRILFDGTELAGFFDNPAHDVRVNGKIVTRTVEIIGAAAVRNYDRGNLATGIAFTARREFDKVKEAEVFLLTHFAGLTKKGTCEIQCGLSGDDTQSVYFYDAVLSEVPRGIYSGVSVWVDYTILAGAPSMEALP